MTEFEKKFAEAALEKATNEIKAYANKDKLAGQVVIRTISDPEFLNFIKLTMQAICIMEILEKDEKND